MKPIKTIWRLLRSLLQRSTVKEDIEEELRFHIGERTKENTARGMPPDAAARPTVLLPYTLVAPPDRTLAIHAAGNTSAIVNSVRDVVRTLDPVLPLGNTHTIEDAMRDQTATLRFTMALFTLFAVFGLTLATAGIYSVLSYLVTQRTREIGVRTALGAQRSDVHVLILKDGGWLAGLGILIGALLSVATARLLASQIQLFGVTSGDLISFFAVALLLTLVSALACWLPARRAAKVDPMVALRHE